MKKPKKFKALKVSLALATFIVIAAGGAAFAVLQSQQNALTGNIISTATANLALSTDGTTFTSSQAGYEFSNIVPGGAAVPTAGYPFYLKNTGGAPLAIKFSVPSVPSNPNQVNLSKVNVILTTVGSGGSPQSFSLQSLIDANSTGGIALASANLSPSYTQQYKLQVSMAADAVVQSSASLGNIDFAFTGLVQ